MSLVLKNFNKQTVITPNEVELLIKRLPKKHLMGLKFIVFDPSRFFQRSYVQPVIPNRAIKGEFHQQMLDAIILYEITDKKTFIHLIYHEIGHYVFSRKLEPRQRKHWVTKLHRQSGFVTDYARVNAAEDFAESYAYYFQDKDFSGNLKAKQDFLMLIS